MSKFKHVKTINLGPHKFEFHKRNDNEFMFFTRDPMNDDCDRIDKTYISRESLIDFINGLDELLA